MKPRRYVWIIEAWSDEYQEWRPYFVGPFSSRRNANDYREDAGFMDRWRTTWKKSRVVRYVPESK